MCVFSEIENDYVGNLRLTASSPNLRDYLHGAFFLLVA